MSVDDLISSALEGRGGNLESTNIFAVVGDPIVGEIFVMNLREFFSDNFSLFLNSESSCAILIGAYRREEDARKCIELIQEGKDHAPGLVGDNAWHILLWKKESEQLIPCR